MSDESWLIEAEQLRARVRELEAALKPFADLACSIDGSNHTRRFGDKSALIVDPGFSVSMVRPNLGDCRRAARLLEGKE